METIIKNQFAVAFASAVSGTFNLTKTMRDHVEKMVDINSEIPARIAMGHSYLTLIDETATAMRDHVNLAHGENLSEAACREDEKLLKTDAVITLKAINNKATYARKKLAELLGLKLEKTRKAGQHGASYEYSLSYKAPKVKTPATGKDHNAEKPATMGHHEASQLADKVAKQVNSDLPGTLKLLVDKHGYEEVAIALEFLKQDSGLKAVS